MAILILPKRVFATVKRDMTDETPVTVFEHEIPILEEIHGEGAVTVIDEKNYDEMQIVVPQLKEPIDANAELSRLMSVYGAHAEIPMSNVEVVYGKNQLKRFALAAGAKRAEAWLEKKAAKNKAGQQATG